MTVAALCGCGHRSENHQDSTGRCAAWRTRTTQCRCLKYEAREQPEPSVTIQRGHALDLIEGIEKVDCLFTDPPYAFGNQGTTEHAISATVATVLREAAHKLRKGGWAIVFCASSWRSTAYMIEATRGILEPIRFGTWCKPEARTKVKTPGWAWTSVNVIVFRKGAKPAWGDPTLLLDYIVEPPVMNGRRAELPPAVAEWAVAPFCLDGGVALDPFAGTGRLLEAAANHGMTGIGFEIDPTARGFCDEVVA